MHTAASQIGTDKAKVDVLIFCGDRRFGATRYGVMDQEWKVPGTNQGVQAPAPDPNNPRARPCSNTVAFTMLGQQLHFMSFGFNYLTWRRSWGLGRSSSLDLL